jgi:hypothetical protein
MNQEEATRLKQAIEQRHPEVTCEVRQYAGKWSVEVTNPRTNETFNVVDPATWQDRLANMEGLV